MPKKVSAVRGALLSAAAAIGVGALAMVAYAWEAYWLLVLIAVGVGTFVLVLFFHPARFYKRVVWACLELLSLFLMVPSLRAAGVLGEDSGFVVVVDSVGTGGFLGLCGVCAVAMIISAVTDYIRARSEAQEVLVEVKAEGEGIAPVAIGEGAVQEVMVDRSHRQAGGTFIEHLEVKGDLIINMSNYVDGLPEAPNVEVRGLFEKGRELSAAGKYRGAVEEFERCLRRENDSKKRGALGLQIGNCYYGMRQYVKAAEYYALGLRESRSARDVEGEASNLGSIANTYLERPAGTIASRGENVREGVRHYFAALEIYKKDEYPVQYATTQNNLGTAYTALPSATAEERAKNVRAAIECYGAALEIYKKDEYPQLYCQTAANMGLLLASVDSPDACHWLKEAYALREYLEDQGKRLEEVMDKVCKE